LSFFSELRRRNVFRVAATYAVVAWLIIQVNSAVSGPLNLPGWFETIVIVLLALGFPVALVLAWAFELTPDGIKLTQAPDGTTPSGTTRLDYALIAALGLVAAITVWTQLRIPVPDAVSPSIAVLPFNDMSPNKDQEYFADGMAEELLNVLTRLDGLRVAGRTSSFAYKGRNEDLRTIGHELDVSTILEGSVRKSGQRIRITAQLINAADGYHLWSETFDRELTDIFAIQEEIATSVAGALGVRLGVGNVNAFVGAGTRNIDAYEAYLKGWTLAGSSEEAIGFLETATQLDPNYATAWAALGLNTASLQWSARPEEAPAILDRAFGYASRAVELDPMSGQSVSLLGTVRYARFDWIGGEKAHMKAIRLRADRSSYEQYGNLLMRAGRLGAADVQYDAALRAEPMAGPATLFGWAVSLARGQYADARSKLSVLYEGREPDDYMLLIALNEGDRETIAALLASAAPNSPKARSLYAPVLRDLGSPEAVLNTLRDLNANDNGQWPSKYQDIALWAAYFGDAEFALQAFERDARYMAIRLQTLWFPVMSDVRHLPGFRTLMRDINLVDFWQASGWPDACEPLEGESFSCT
jgi:TolB-like protein/Tfp pilus assembly protein PilF